jgi:hypothetical protein
MHTHKAMLNNGNDALFAVAKSGLVLRLIQREYRTTTWRLPEKTELELLTTLSNPKLKQQPFYSVCNRDKTLFGEKNSELLCRVINARYNLNTNSR